MNTQISSPNEGGGGIIHLHSYFSIGQYPPLVQRGGGLVPPMGMDSGKLFLLSVL